MTEKEIIELLSAGKESGIRAVIETFGDRFVRIAGHYLSEEDAAECVNDLYLALWERVPKEKPDHLFAYAVRILRNLAITRLRAMNAAKRKTEIVALTDELADVIADPRANTEDEAIARVDRPIARFLERFDEEKRYLFIHRYFFGESISELVKTTGFSKSKIEVTLFRLRKKLKTFLNDEERK